MLKIIHKRTQVKLDPRSAKSLQSHLQGRFNSLLAGVRLEYARRLGLDDEDLTPTPVDREGRVQLGEIFLTQPGTVCFVRYDAEQRVLEASAISSQSDSELEYFFQEVAGCLEAAGAKFSDWQVSDHGASLPSDAEPASTEVSEKELEAARELLKPENRALLERLASEESTLVRQIESAGIQGLTRLLQHFEDLELIRKDYAVIDQKTGQQILRVPSRASLEEASQKFFIGGTAISNDNVDEVLSCTPFCRHLLTNDQWLLILLLGTLKKLNLDSDSVFVCRSEDGPSRVFLQTSQQKFLVVLSNRRLSLDDAYMVGAQVAAYGIQDIILVSAEKTSTLMKHHLRQANTDASFAFIDSLNDLDSQLSTILLERQRAFLKELLEPLAEFTPVRVQDLIVRKMSPESLEEVDYSEVETPEPDTGIEDSEGQFESAEYGFDSMEDESPARLIADSFEGPPPGSLPAFDTAAHPEPARPVAPRQTPPETPSIQIELPVEEPSAGTPAPAAPAAHESTPIAEQPPATPLPSPADSDQQVPPASAERPAQPSAAPPSFDGVPEMVGDLPEAEELIPDLPLATEAARSEG